MRIRGSLVIIFCLLLIVGCSNQVGSMNENEQARITVTDHADREVKFAEPPKRIVSLVQGDMDILYQLGAEIVGGPTVSKDLLPTELANIEQVGTAHEADFEKIVSLKPDLIIGHAGLNMKDVSTVESLGLKMFLTNSNSYESILEVIDQYGKILERENEAKEMIAEIEAKKKEIEQKPLTKDVRALIIYGTTDLFLAALPTSLSGDLLATVGGENVASDLPGIESYPDYAQLSMERVIEANPDVIYFITHGEPEAVKEKFESELKSNPSWKKIKALENDNFVLLPYELFGTNPGPKLAESLTYIRENLESIAAEN
ncbi:ABC transporter substrate-binding protein [Peribacillus sp. JNUCC 23]|uniref:ABC transporter substrate-binding protein n=1 Tax=Peribacillus sp. NPDC096379 TaxID=3364393 RepID=UPI0037F8E797